MQAHDITQYNNYRYTLLNYSAAYDRTGQASNPKNQISQSAMQLQIVEFEFKSYTFAHGEISTQSKEFDFNLAGGMPDLEITNLDLNQINPGGSEQLNRFFDEDGYWGIAQTADRLANFVLNGAGNDINKLRQGREGIIRGFKEAEQIWGETLPEISYKTLEKALEQIDNKIHKLGEPVIDIAACFRAMPSK